MIFKQMVQRAGSDAEFMRRCLEDPEGAYRETTGRGLPAGANLRFHYTAEGVELIPLYVPPLANADEIG